jgi:hypothetical protein
MSWNRLRDLHVPEDRRHVMRIATGQIEDRVPSPEDKGKDPAAVALGRRGGKARAEAMSKKRRKEIAQKAARARWKDA